MEGNLVTQLTPEQKALNYQHTGFVAIKSTVRNSFNMRCEVFKLEGGIWAQQFTNDIYQHQRQISQVFYRQKG